MSTLSIWQLMGRSKLENPLQKAIFVAFGECPDGDERVETSWEFLAEFCCTTIEDVKIEVAKMMNNGIMWQAKPCENNHKDSICFRFGGAQ